MIFHVVKTTLKSLDNFLNDIVYIVITKLLKKMTYLVHTSFLSFLSDSTASDQRKSNLWVFTYVLSQFSKIDLLKMNICGNLCQFLTEKIEKIQGFNNLRGWIFLVLI